MTVSSLFFCKGPGVYPLSNNRLTVTVVLTIFLRVVEQALRERPRVLPQRHDLER